LDNPKFQHLYSNFVSLQTSNVDARIGFGLIKDADETTVNVFPLIEMYLTHSQLKALYELLGRNLPKSIIKSVDAPEEKP